MPISLPSLEQLTAWLWPLAFVLAGLFVGLLFERYVLDRLKTYVDGGKWKWDEVVVNALGRGPLLWFVALGMWAAVEGLDLSAQIAGTLQTGIAVLVIFSLTLVAARVGSNAVHMYARRSEKGLPASSLITNITKALIYVLGLMMILPQLGIEITPLITGLGIGGLAVALALQDTLSNLFSGFQIILTRQVVTGDYIQLETGQEGYVQDVQWRNTTIKSRLDDAETVIPNRKLADNVVTNYSMPRNPMWVKLEVGVHYESDLERVEEITLDVARQVADEVEGAAGDTEPVIRYRSFGDSAVTFVTRVKVEEFDRQFLVKHEFIKRLHRRFEEEGITIPFPIRTLDVPDAFRVRQEEVTEGA
ncbi:MAG: mechanosensitive ion channel family protein [Candidatus Palauibacterales bacterium]|nr:mechanosensitive ion channel family protein [Candidatus Palauibacterales bacterium]